MQTAAWSLPLVDLLLMIFFFWFVLRKSSADCDSKPPKAPSPRAELARAITKQEGEWKLVIVTGSCDIQGPSLPAASDSICCLCRVLAHSLHTESLTSPCVPSG